MGGGGCQGAAPHRQGHSKNPASDDCDGFGAVFAEVLAGFGHGKASGSDEGYHEISDCREPSATGAGSAPILVHRDIADPVQPVLDCPVVPFQFEKSHRAGFSWGKAGDEIGDLGADLVADLACALDACDLGGAWPLQVRHDLGADRDPACLQPAVALVGGLGRCQIRRESGFCRARFRRGKSRRNSRRSRLSELAGCPSRRTHNGHRHRGCVDRSRAGRRSRRRR